MRKPLMGEINGALREAGLPERPINPFALAGKGRSTDPNRDELLKGVGIFFPSHLPDAVQDELRKQIDDGIYPGNHKTRQRAELALKDVVATNAQGNHLMQNGEVQVATAMRHWCAVKKFRQ